MKRFASLLLLVAAGCGTRSANWNGPLDVVGPVAASGNLVWLDRTASVVEVLDPSGTRSSQSVAVMQYPRDLAATPSGFLVSGGRGDAPQVEVVALPGGTSSRVPVAGTYDHIAVSPDGAHAILYYDPSAGPAPGGPAARNNNEVTVLDLKALTASVESLSTDSLAPDSVVFSPDPTLAAIVMDTTLVLIDLTQPQSQVQIPLNLPNGTQLHPVKVLFAPDGSYLYVQAGGSDDVLALQVIHSNSGLSSAVNFLFLPGAAGLTDIAVPQGSSFTHAVAALYQGPGNGSAALLDAAGDTSLTHSLQLTEPGTSISDLGGGMLLVSAAGSPRLTGWEPLVDRAAVGNLTAAGVGSPLIEPGAAFFVQAAVTTSTGTSAALTGLRLTDTGAQLLTRQNPLVLQASPTASAIDPVSGLLLLGVPVSGSGTAAPIPTAGTTSSTAAAQTGAVVTVNPATLAIGSLILDDTITAIGVVGRYGYALHPSPLGDVSFFPLANPSRDNARRVYGFLSGGILGAGGSL